jgi:hypothetical protein
MNKHYLKGTCYLIFKKIIKKTTQLAQNFKKKKKERRKQI